MSDNDTEFAWVIEAGGPRYWTGRGGPNNPCFDADPNQALRFAREDDAQRAWFNLLPELVQRTTVIRQHGWVKS